MLGSISSALGLWSDISQQIEYWRDFKGEEIWIRSHSIERDEPRGSKFSHTTYIIKGNIKDVKSFPPGFLLTEVEEMVHMSDFGVRFVGTNSDRVTEGRHAQETVRTIDEKFISFNSINELERGEHVEKAEEPFRRENTEE
mgnify:CR=1 FL=1